MAKRAESNIWHSVSADFDSVRVMGRRITFALAAQLDADGGQDGHNDGSSGHGDDQVDQPVVTSFPSFSVRLL